MPCGVEKKTHPSCPGILAKVWILSKGVSLPLRRQYLRVPGSVLREKLQQNAHRRTGVVAILTAKEGYAEEIKGVTSKGTKQSMWVPCHRKTFWDSGDICVCVVQHSDGSPLLLPDCGR